MRRWARAQRWVAAAASFTVTAGVAALATAQASFKQAPSVEQAEDGGPDTILGLIHVNTAFFIAVGVIAFFWFLFGGERKAKIGRKN